MYKMEINVSDQLRVFPFSRGPGCRKSMLDWWYDHLETRRSR